MEWFVTSPHCDTQSEDTVGINPYTLLCPAATLQATSRRIGREHRTQCARVSRFAPQPCHQLSAILTISPPEPPNTLDQLFLTERGPPPSPHLTPNRDNETLGLLLK